MFCGGIEMHNDFLKILNLTPAKTAAEANTCENTCECLAPGGGQEDDPSQQPW